VVGRGEDDVTELLSVVAEVGTPAYLYDLAEVRANQQRLRAGLPARARLYYPLAVNPHPELLREIRAGGALPEVRSSGELDTALVAGWPARDVLVTGPGRRDEEVDWALRLGVRNFTVDSPTGLEQVNRRAAAHGAVARCLLRVTAGTPGQSDMDNWWVLAEPRRPHVRIVGLHLCAPEVAAVRRLAEMFSAQGVRIDELTVCCLDDPFDGSRLTGLFEARMAFEVGRFLVGAAGTLVTAVLDVRQAAGRQVVVCESDANHVGVLADRSLVPRLISRNATEAVDSVVVGPLEMSPDVWTSSVLLPRLRPGDLLAVPDVGASGPTAGLVAYGSPRLPVEVVVDVDDPDTIVHVSRLAVTRYPAS
jgi:diaminopimelate decarboxylase